MDKNNDELSLIYVTYFTQTKIIEEKSFISSSKFNDIIEYFKENIQKRNSNLELKEIYKFKNTQINKLTYITDLFDKNTNFENRNIFIELEDKLDFNEDKDEFNIEPNKESDISIQPVFKDMKLIENNNISNTNSININGSSIFKIEENEEYNNSQKEESNESKVKDEIKNLKYLKNEGTKLKMPKIPKMNQSQIITSYKLNSRNIDNKILSKSMYSMYRADEDDTYLENDGDNYHFHDMTPHYKKKKKNTNSNNNKYFNSSSKLELRIKNPFSESKIIKKRKINGLNYSVIYEKEVDKNDLPFYDNFELEEAYTCDNDFGNHRLYISQYLIDAKKAYKSFQEERTQRQMNNKYNLQDENSDDMNVIKTERNKKHIKIVIPDLKLNSKNNNNIINKGKKKKLNFNNNKLYVVKKKNYSDEKKKLKERKLSYNIEKKNQPIKTISNYLTERVIERTRHLSKRFLSGRTSSVSPGNNFVPTKLRTAERKIEGVTGSFNYKTPEKNNAFFKKITSSTKDKKYKTIASPNNKEINIKPVIKMDNNYSGKNKLPLLVKKESNKSKNNDENEFKSNMMEEYENLKPNNSIEDINQKKQLKNYKFPKTDLRKNIILFDSKKEEEKEEGLDMNKDEEVKNPCEDNNNIKDINPEISNINEEKLSYIISENKKIKIENNEQKRNEQISIRKEDEKIEKSQDNNKQSSIISASDEIKNNINKNSLFEKEEKEDFIENMNANDNDNDNLNNKDIIKNNCNESDNEIEKNNDKLSKNSNSDKNIEISQNNQFQNYNIFNINKSIEMNSNSENAEIKEEEKKELEPDNSNIEINEPKSDEKDSKLNLSDNKKEKLKINIDKNEQENIKNVFSNGTFRHENTLDGKNSINGKSDNNNILNNNDQGIILTNDSFEIDKKNIENNYNNNISNNISNNLEENKSNEIHIEDSLNNNYNNMNNLGNEEIQNEINDNDDIVNSDIINKDKDQSIELYNNDTSLKKDEMNEDVANNLKRKKTQLNKIPINENENEFDINKENLVVSEIINDEKPIIEFESSFKDREEIPFYKEKSKKIPEINFHLPKNNIEEQVFRREVIIGSDESIKNQLNKNEDKKDILLETEKENRIINKDKNGNENIKLNEENNDDKNIFEMKENDVINNNSNDENENINEIKTNNSKKFEKININEYNIVENINDENIDQNINKDEKEENNTDGNNNFSISINYDIKEKINIKNLSENKSISNDVDNINEPNTRDKNEYENPIKNKINDESLNESYNKNTINENEEKYEIIKENIMEDKDKYKYNNTSGINNESLIEKIKDINNESININIENNKNDNVNDMEILNKKIINKSDESNENEFEKKNSIIKEKINKEESINNIENIIIEDRNKDEFEEEEKNFNNDNLSQGNDIKENNTEKIKEKGNKEQDHENINNTEFVANDENEKIFKDNNQKDKICLNGNKNKSNDKLGNRMEDNQNNTFEEQSLFKEDTSILKDNNKENETDNLIIKENQTNYINENKNITIGEITENENININEKNIKEENNTKGNVNIEKNENAFHKNGNNENEICEKIENIKNVNETYVKDENGEDDISKLKNDNSVESKNKPITTRESNKKEIINLDEDKYNENKNKNETNENKNKNKNKNKNEINENENELFKETELIRIESSPIEINDEKYLKRISKRQINFIINKSNLFNQLISTEIIKEKAKEDKTSNIIQNETNNIDNDSIKDIRNSANSRNSKFDSKFVLKRLEQISEDNNNCNDNIRISISKESIPNKINVSKNVKIHENFNSTLYDIMDEPSYTNINIKFPEVKPIIFKQKDFNFRKSEKDIKMILRNSIPESLIKSRTNRKRNLSVVYTPQKIKNGRRCFISQKKTNKNISLIERKSCEMKREQKLTNNYGSIKDAYIPCIKKEKKNDKNAYRAYYDNNFNKNSNDSKEVINVNSIYTQKMISPLSKKKINRLKKKVDHNIKVFNLGYIKINNK